MNLDSSAWCSARCPFAWQRAGELVHEEPITPWRTGDPATMATLGSPR